MTAEQIKVLLSTPAFLFVMMLAASLSNGLSQLLVIKQSGTPPTFARYLSYWPETLAVLLGNGIAFAALIMTDQLNFASALGVGFGVNTIADLLPGKRAMALKSTPDDPAKVETPLISPEDKK